MKLGIKVGLRSDWKSDLMASKPEFAEIWFHAGKIPEYDPLFAFCQAQEIPTGLHFWGATALGILANLAYPDNEILKASRLMVMSTLETAARNNSLYVNLHPSASVLSKVDFTKEEFVPFGQPGLYPQVLQILRESLTLIAEYGEKLGVPITVESVPKMALGSPWTGTDGRTKPVKIGEFAISDIEKILPIANIYFANDFGHTAGNVISENRTQVKDYVFEITRRLAPITRLLHVSYIIPPYNGTDYHGCLYNSELQTGTAVPNYNELGKLLRLFVNRSDVYALVEPEKDHPGNFTTLKKLVSEVS